MTRNASLLPVMLCVAACGRIDFEGQSDAPAGRRVSFGETGAETFSGVTADTSLDQSNPTFNLGTHSVVKAGNTPTQVALLRFDLTGAPATSRVLAAELHFHVQTDPLTAGTVSQMFRVLEPWDEGTTNNLPGAASWTERMPGVPWTTPGAEPPSRGTEVVAEITPSVADTFYVVPLMPAGVAMVGEWIATPASNFGIAIPPPDNSGWAFTSSESVNDVSWRPVLVLWLDP